MVKKETAPVSGIVITGAWGAMGNTLYGWTMKDKGPWNTKRSTNCTGSILFCEQKLKMYFSAKQC